MWERGGGGTPLSAPLSRTRIPLSEYGRTCTSCSHKGRGITPSALPRQGQVSVPRASMGLNIMFPREDVLQKWVAGDVMAEAGTNECAGGVWRRLSPFQFTTFHSPAAECALHSIGLTSARPR